MKQSLIGFSMLVAAGASWASLFPEKSEYYYALGGGSDLYVPAVSKTEKINIGGDIRADGVLNCGVFNPVISIGNAFNGIKEKIAGVPASMVDGLKGGVAGYPMYKLSQSMPALYNIIQNTAFSGYNEFQAKVNHCYQVKRNLENGSSPVSAILSVSDSAGWIEASQRAAANSQHDPVDLTETTKTIAQKSDEYGIPWVHRDKGNSGGVFQAPIEVISDVVIAGYNLLLTPSRHLDDTTPVTESMRKTHPFAQVWATPKAASEWAVYVLGDLRISHAKTTGSKDAKAGVGLVTLLKSCPAVAESKTCTANVADYLWQLVDGKLTLTEANLRKLSPGSVLITRDIISSISLLAREEQIITVSKLAEEIAMQNVLEDALMLKRILETGYQIQEVQNLKPVQDMIKQAIARLESEIKGLSFEQEVRKRMMTDTLNIVMDVRRQQLKSAQPSKSQGQEIIKEGALYTQAKEGQAS
ncbi:integrating conjugative element protein [Legionella fairfieldensis]|uniref:integrating conjugative element protein n=1 Tax=Legionella fairfieldensis TaxID=45064 RepID=UPI00048CF2D7|nr:integrating conjugative element protein [Legionella fairfieldensis]